MKNLIGTVVMTVLLAGCAGTSTDLRTGADVPADLPSPFVEVNTTTVAPVATPSSLPSLQPFVTFPKGAGEGVAYHYHPRTKAQFVALLRDKALAKKEMRLSCDKLVQQMVEAHPSLPFEGCEGAAAAIAGDVNFSVVPCQDQMFKSDNWLAVTNKEGTKFGVWHRQCYPREQVLMYKSEPIVSTTCLNAAIPAEKLAAPTGPVVGCVEIHLAQVRAGDIGIKGFIAGPENVDVLHNACTGYKAVGEASFKPLPNDLCDQALPIMCNFGSAEARVGEPERLKFSFFVKPDTAYVLRLPPSLTTAVSLVRSLLTAEPGTAKGYQEAVRYSETNNAFMGIPPGCYVNNVADVYYGKNDIPATAYCQLYLNVPRTDASP